VAPTNSSTYLDDIHSTFDLEFAISLWKLPSVRSLTVSRALQFSGVVIFIFVLNRVLTIN